MLYFPWWETYATFNFADSFIIVDCIVLIVFIIINLFKDTETGRTGKVA
jgi:lipoprotein signal peptidase